MNQILKRLGFVAFGMALLVSAASAQTDVKAGNRLGNLLIEDSLTPAKAQLRNYVAELRDSLVFVESVQSRITNARAAKSTAVVVSQGRELARRCLIGASMVELTTKRVEPMGTPDPRGETAMAAYRNALVSLQGSLRDCAHFDSLTLAAPTVDQERLENIATAARESIMHYDLVRDGLMRLMTITLPVSGDIYHH